MMPTIVNATYGTFTAADNYQTTMTSGGQHGSMVGAKIDFTFSPSVGSTMADRLVGLIQACRVTRPGIPLAEQLADEPLLQRRITASPSGWYIDQYSYALDGKKLSEADAGQLPGPQRTKLIPQTNPVYNAMNVDLSKLARSLRDNVDKNDFGEVYKPTGAAPARLVDSPSRVVFPTHDLMMTQEFETAAITLNGDPQYLGSIRWGYTAQRVGTTSTYTLALVPFALVSNDRPSATFFEAARAWNDQKLPEY